MFQILYSEWEINRLKHLKNYRLPVFPNTILIMFNSHLEFSVLILKKKSWNNPQINVRLYVEWTESTITACSLCCCILRYWSVRKKSIVMSFENKLFFPIESSYPWKLNMLPWFRMHISRKFCKPKKKIKQYTV